MRKMILLVGALAGLGASILPLDRVEANHVSIAPPTATTVAPAPAVTVVPAPTVPAPTVTVVPAPAPAPATVTVVPAPSTVVVPAPSGAVAPLADQTLRVQQVRSQVVRARAIYANRIEADQVKGVIHHTNGVRVEPATPGEVVGSDVGASVIYADAISANTVIADNVYVNELEMSPSRFVIAPLQSGVVVRRQSP